jgi:hypothetical protein
MKRFWLVLLSLGIVLAFSASAFAVDVKFSGSFYAAGMYLDKTTFRSTDEAAIGTVSNGSVGPSTAFYYQRLRVQTDFIVSPGLKLVTRFDAMERIWGGARSTTATVTDSSGTRAENENISIDWAYINYVSPIGTFDVGIMNDGSTGTIFGNSYAPAGRIKYSYTIGPATINASYTKVADNSFSAVNGRYIANKSVTDADNDKYGIEGVYAWKDGKAGMQIAYYRYAANRPVDTSLSKKTYFLLTPYAIAKIGPVAVQAELNYAFGEATDQEDPSKTDVELRNLTGWIDATADFGTIYFGGTFAYVSGNDPNTADKEEGGTLNGGRDWNPTLIMFNQDITYWVGAINGYHYSGSAVTSNASPMSNAWFGQGRIGVKPIPALDIMASLSYAKADKLPGTGANAVLDKEYGWEVDVTGTYKITNNLSYMLGFGYLFTGDYYKGHQTQDVENNYMLINKLTLTF